MHSSGQLLVLVLWIHSEQDLKVVKSLVLPTFCITLFASLLHKCHVSFKEQQKRTTAPALFYDRFDDDDNDCHWLQWVISLFGLVFRWDQLSVGLSPKLSLTNHRHVSSLTSSAIHRRFRHISLFIFELVKKWSGFRSPKLNLNWLIYAKSTGVLISFRFSDRSVQSLVSAKRSANCWVQTKKWLHFLADLWWSQSEFRTQRNAKRKTDPKSEMTRMYWLPWETISWSWNVCCYWHQKLEAMDQYLI